MNCIEAIHSYVDADSAERVISVAWFKQTCLNKEKLLKVTVVHRNLNRWKENLIPHDMTTLKKVVNKFLFELNVMNNWLIRVIKPLSMFHSQI